MIQAYSTNCSPIKPQAHQQSFGNREVIAATADWLDNINGNQLTEDNFASLQNITEKMHDGPLKTFAKIMAIGGASFVVVKAGTSKIAKKVTANPTIQKNITRPVTRFVHNALENIGKKIQKSKYYGENVKGFKAFFVNSADKTLKGIKKYGERGSENLIQNIDTQLVKFKAEAGKAKSQIKKAQVKEIIKNLNERKKLASTENLITKITTTTAATGAGATAVVGANKDSDGNGIADIGERN